MKRRSYITGLTLIITALVSLAFIALTDTIGFVMIWVLLGTASITLLYSLILQLKKVIGHTPHGARSKHFTTKNTATLMGLFLVLGTMQYVFVFWYISKESNVEFNNAEYLLRSLICSLDLFMLDIDSSILDHLNQHTMLKAWISFQAVLSFSCTVMMLVGLVYSRLNAYYKLTYRTRIDKFHNHLYLFFGMNSASETLIKDIMRNDTKAVIILIVETKVNEEGTNDWDGIVDFATHKHKTFDLADKHSIRVAIAEKPLRKIDEEITSQVDFDAFGSLGLFRIAKLIEKLRKVNDAELHIFFLDESEERNIRDIITLAKDKKILELPDSGIYHKIYCHARYNGPNRVIQDVAVRKKLNIKIIDSSHIAVERLKMLPEYHPFNVVEIIKENPGTVKGAFNALIVGFGEVGRDAFRFLYEFGAFVNENATLTKATRSQFNCTIVDKDIKRIKGTLKAGMPGIFKSGSGSNHIEFKDIDYNHEDFYNDILSEDKVAALNYVVISIGDNDEAIGLATRIFNRFRQYGGDLSKLMILVRCTDDSKYEAVQKIADHYNNGYGKGENNRPVIRIFGLPKETYTYELVISDRLIMLGKIFHDTYRTVKGEGVSWDERHKACTHTHVPEIDKLRKLRRQESQDTANALHVHTKKAILAAAMPQHTDWTSFYDRYFKKGELPNRTGHKSGITYPDMSEYENLVILRLAMLEHLRWNAAHELLGYVRRDDGVAACDETTMRHNCLKSWDELDAESELTEKSSWPCDYKEYDFAVVDTTIALSYAGNRK